MGDGEVCSWRRVLALCRFLIQVLGWVNSSLFWFQDGRDEAMGFLELGHEVRQRGERVIRRDVIAQKQALNGRQAQVVDVLLGLDSMAIEDLGAALPGIPRRTLQRDLQLLVEKRIAVAEGAARSRRYRLKDKRVR